MNTGFAEFAVPMLFAIATYGVVLWILWKFYGVLARIGEELGAIKTVLQQRLPPPQGPGDR
jgi:hypothetical protein